VFTGRELIVVLEGRDGWEEGRANADFKDGV
jgi:hypothetical protein